jgi:hypothetical protein
MIVFNCGLLFASSASSFLFFLRVRAVYSGRPLVTWIFGFLWVCVVGAAITVPIGIKAIKVGGSLCLVSKVPAYAGAAATVLMVNDTLVVLAISYRLLTNTHRDNAGVGERLRAFFSGANLHAYSMAVFRDGQKYYMCVLHHINLSLNVYFYDAQDNDPQQHGHHLTRVRGWRQRDLPRHDVHPERRADEHHGVSGVP